MDVPLLEGALDFQHPPCSDTCCLYHSSLQQHYPLLLWSWPEPQLCALRISSCWRGSVLFHSSGFPVLTRKTSDRYCQCLGIIYTKKALLPHHFWKLLKATTNIFCLFFLPRFGHINFSVPLSMWLHSSPHRSHHFSRLRKPQLSLPDTALELCLSATALVQFLLHTIFPSSLRRSLRLSTTTEMNQDRLMSCQRCLVSYCPV